MNTTLFYILFLVFSIALTAWIFTTIIRVFVPTAFNPKRFCKDCEATKGTIIKLSGNGFVELLCWLIPPIGLLYSIKRRTGKTYLCGTCNGTKTIDRKAA